MRGVLGGIVLTLLVIAGVGLLVITFGLFPIGADNPPSAIERRLANMATDAYVGAHAPNQANPVPPVPAALADGARLYERHCAFCHGGAAHRISVMRAKFSPPVPQIVNRIPGDPDSHLWWVAKHGIRMTGMPSWDGILTDDQIWTVIAFVKHSGDLPPEAQAAWRAAAGLTRAGSQPTSPPAVGKPPAK